MNVTASHPALLGALPPLAALAGGASAEDRLAQCGRSS